MTDQPTPPTRTGLLIGLIQQWREISGVCRESQEWLRNYGTDTAERITKIEADITKRCADELQAAVQEMRCETCRFYLQANGETAECELWGDHIPEQVPGCLAHQSRTER